MKNQRCKWLGLTILLLAALLVMGGCGGGSSSTPPPTAAKAAISGTVSFPLIDNMVAKQVPKSVSAPVYGVPTVELRNLSGAVVATATVTGTAPGPYSYTFNNIDMGADYVVKAFVPNTNHVVKALIDKSALTATTTRNVDTVSTTVVIVTEQKLGATPGTMGDTANAAKFTTDAIAVVNPVALEGAINTAIGSVTGTNAANATSNDIKLMNLVNVVTSTVFSDVKTADFIAGSVTAPISTTQYTYVAGAAPVVATVQVPSATVLTTIVAPTGTAYTPPPADSVTFTSRVMDFSGATPVALQGVEVTANGLKTFTDASGFFTLAGITKNTSFYVKMGKSGYADSYSAQQNISANSNSSTRPFALWAPSILTTAWGNTPGSGVISSRVVESTNPETGYLGGVVVTATDSQDPAISYPVIYMNTSGSPDSTLTSTSTAGRWMFRNVPAGRTVNVTATKSGYTFNTRTFLAVADSVSQGRITGTAAATTPTTTSQLRTIITSGLYEFGSNWNGVNTNYYYTDRISLAANGINLTETITSYLDPVSKTWSATVPSGFPANNNTEYSLTTSGWLLTSDSASNYTVTFNSDGSATIVNALSGNSAQITITPVDVTGQAISIAGLDGAPLVSAPTVFPSGSLRYDIVWNQLTEYYSLWDSYGNQLGTDLTLIPGMFVAGTGMQVYIDSNNINSFYGQFVGGASSVVNIYQQGVTSPVLIGTATYSVTTVHGQQILEISIPSALRTQYRLGGNPIFSLAPTGSIMQGEHWAIGVDPSEGGENSYNEIAITHIRNNINTALAKPVLARKISKALLGM